MGRLKRIELPRGALGAISALEEAGFEAYAVGGAVRDLLRGVEPLDLDIATAALPEQVKEVFQGLKIYETGIKHGTVTVIFEGLPLEITTYRVESTYSDGRHPDGVRFSKLIEADLSRRDFTVNAVAFSPGRGLVDPFGGVTDLENRVIRAVGEPKKRFDEDGLRVMRALRFAAVLGFEIEGETAAALFANKAKVLSVSAERVSAELGKLLCGDGAVEVLEGFREIFSAVYPQLEGACFDALGRVNGTLELRLGALFYELGAEKALSLSADLRFSRDAVETALMLASEARRELKDGKPFVKREMRRLGAENFKKCLEFRTAICPEPCVEKALSDCVEALRGRECYELKGLKVKGEDLIDAGVEKGRALGEALEALLDAVVEGRVENDRDCLLRYFFDSLTDNKKDGA